MALRSILPRSLTDPFIPAGLFLAVVTACTPPGAPRPERTERFPSLRPGDTRLRSRRPAGAECFEYATFGANDTAGHLLGPLAIEWGPRGEGRQGATWLRSAYARQTEDTMFYETRSLAPDRETLRVGDQHISLRYRDATVERRVQRGDSAGPWRKVTFDRPVFGFNQREELLRLTRLETGDTLILPLYSEIDAALELDTISLMPPAPSVGLEHRIRMRFADPAIVALVTVDTLTSRILEEEIRNRRHPGRLMRTLLPSGEACERPAGST